MKKIYCFLGMIVWQMITAQQSDFKIVATKVLSTEIPPAISNVATNTLRTPTYLHDTKGAFDVSNSGQAQYSLPIVLPPGIKNVAPQVYLNYVSGGSMGNAGYGWNVSGISTISRTSANIENDGFIDNPDGDANDSYALDGQKLLLKSGTYGGNNAMYQTQQYSNLRIESFGVSPYGANFGPLKFVVTFPDGSMVTYGGIATAISPLEYHITEWKDAQGNAIHYTYTKTQNMVKVAQINWGGNVVLGKADFNTITFTYKARKRNDFSYVGGQKIVQTQLLDNVQVATEGSLFKKYQLTHTIDNLNYEKVTQIQEFNGASEPANPIQFSYTDTGNAISYTQYQSTSDINMEQVKLSGDFDGNGEVDFVANNKVYLSGLNNNWKGMNLPFNNDTNEKIFVTTTLTNDLKINQKQSLLKFNIANSSISNLEINLYSVNNQNNNINLDYTKNIPTPYIYPDANYAPSLKYDKKEDYVNFNLSRNNDSKLSILSKEYVGDFDGDGASETLFTSVRFNQVCTQTIYFAFACIKNVKDFSKPKLFDIKPNSDVILGSSNYNEIDESEVQLKPYIKQTASIDNLNFNEKYIFDYNGDGRDDIFQIDTQTKEYQAITIEKNNNGKKFVLLSSGTLPEYTKDKQLVFGDYNGDGKTDILVPLAEGSRNWKMYVSTGQGFETFDYNNFYLYQPHQGPGAARAYREYWRQYRAADLNKDGKSDFIVTEYEHYFEDCATCWNDESSKATYYYRQNMGSTLATGQPNFSALTSNTIFSGDGHPIMALVGDFKQHQANYQMTFVQYNTIWKFGFSKNQKEEANVQTITEGNGQSTQISYDKLDAYATTYQNQNTYSANNQEFYPYVEINQMPTMTVVDKVTTSQKTQWYKYQGLTAHLHGRGILGFKKVAKTSWNALSSMANSIRNQWVVSQTLPQLYGTNIRNWTYIGTEDPFVEPTLDNNTNYLNEKNTTYLHNVIPFVPKQVNYILPKEDETKDYLKNSFEKTTYSYDDYKNILITSTNKNNEGTITEVYSYINLPQNTGNQYAIGRLQGKYTTLTAYNDQFLSREEYSYANNLLTSYKKWGNGTADFIEEKYTSYDGFGNLLTKTLEYNDGNTITASRNFKDEYETRGRFVIKKTDPVGLVTQYTYNALGQMLTEISPFAVQTTNTWDRWGKLLTNTNSLNGTINYSYTRTTQGGLLTTSNLPDGNLKQVETDAWGKEIKITTKGFADNTYIAKTTEYDALDRKIRESEPYFTTQSPTQWTTYFYDDLNRPSQTLFYTGRKASNFYNKFTITTTDDTKTTSKTYDALGNVKTATDEGGTINYTYFANGQVKQTNYENHIISLTQDGWGRKTSLNDPNTGKYIYEYYSYGALKKETEPKGGTTEYLYDAVGRITQKTTKGTHQNDEVNYTYSPKGLLLSQTGFTKTSLEYFTPRNFSNTFTYDTYGRLLTKIEAQTTYGNTFTYTYTYDALGRQATEQKAFTSTTLGNASVTTQNSYKAYNGMLYQLKENSTQKVLWELKDTNEKGQVLSAMFGNGTQVTNTYDRNYFISSAQHKTDRIIMSQTYQWNALKNNLTSRDNAVFGTHENFVYDNLNRLVNWTDVSTGNLHYNTYDKYGRITENNAIGTLLYENNSSRYKPSKLQPNTQGIDYYTQKPIQNITYNTNQDPVYIENKGKSTPSITGMGLSTPINTTQFYYNLNGSRALSQNMYYVDGAGYYVPYINYKYYSENGDIEIKKDQSNNNNITFYLGDTPYNADIIATTSTNSYYRIANSSLRFIYLHKDYLGSITALSDEYGNPLEQRHYDPWGNIVKLIGMGSETLSLENQIIQRGYTGHEHFNNVGLIHMNGRLYDPLLRRFMSADEHIQEPYNTQNYNRYAYVLNNPLLYTDISGEDFGLSLLIAVGTAILTNIGMSYYGQSPVNLGSMAQSIIFAVASAGLSYGVGTIFKGITLGSDFAKEALRAVAHGLAQGAISGVTGGNFLSGFLAGAFSSATSSLYGSVFDGGEFAPRDTNFGQILFGTITGGIGAEIGGGNFFVGAAQGLAVSYFNHTLHKIKINKFVNSVKKFLIKLGYDKNDVENDVIVQKDKKYGKYYAKLNNAKNYIKGWNEQIDSQSKDKAYVSKVLTFTSEKSTFTGTDGVNYTEKLEESYQLKFYTGRADSIGIIRAGVEHYFETGFELLDAGVRSITGYDNTIYDMHGKNANRVLQLLR